MDARTWAWVDRQAHGTAGARLPARAPRQPRKHLSLTICAKLAPVTSKNLSMGGGSSGAACPPGEPDRHRGRAPSRPHRGRHGHARPGAAAPPSTSVHGAHAAGRPSLPGTAAEARGARAPASTTVRARIGAPARVQCAAARLARAAAWAAACIVRVARTSARQSDSWSQTAGPRAHGKSGRRLGSAGRVGAGRGAGVPGAQGPAWPRTVVLRVGPVRECAAARCRPNNGRAGHRDARRVRFLGGRDGEDGPARPVRPVRDCDHRQQRRRRRQDKEDQVHPPEPQPRVQRCV